MVCQYNFLDINPKKSDDQERLFILCRKGVSGDARGDYYEYVQCVNRFVIVISAILLEDAVTGTIRKELKKLSSGLKVENVEIQRIIQNEVLKRDVLKGDEIGKSKESH